MASRQYRKAVGRFTTAALNLHDNNMTIKISLTGTYRCLHWRSHLIPAFGWIIWALAYVLVMKITSNLLQVHSSFTPEWQTVAAWYWCVSLYPSYKILKCEQSNESNRAVLSYCAATFMLLYVLVQTFESVDKIKGRDCSRHPLNCTFLRCCLLRRIKRLYLFIPGWNVNQTLQHFASLSEAVNLFEPMPQWVCSVMPHKPTDFCQDFFF